MIEFFLTPQFPAGLLTEVLLWLLDMKKHMEDRLGYIFLMLGIMSIGKA